jgi:hypothetical protein
VTGSLKSSTTSDLEEITDEENDKALAILNRVQDTWGISPNELTVGPLQDDEDDNIIERFNFGKGSASKYDDSFDLRFYKINMKTSIYVTVGGWPKKSNKRGLEYHVIVGRQGRFKIKEPYAVIPLMDVEDYLKFDTYYIIIYQKSYLSFSLYLNIGLSNEMVNISQIYKTIGIIVGCIFGTFVLICVLCICCRSNMASNCCKALGECFGKCCECFGSMFESKPKTYTQAESKDTLESNNDVNVQNENQQLKGSNITNEDTAIAYKN